MKRTAIMLTAAVTHCAIANADEVWTTEIGDVHYAEEIGAYAVFYYPASEQTEGKAYFKGLAGNYDDRTGTFEGYWVEPHQTTESACDFPIVDAAGDTYQSWGRLKLIFTETAFPSGWVALRGSCLEDPTDPLVGKPILGEEATEAFARIEARKQAMKLDTSENH